MLSLAEKLQWMKFSEQAETSLVLRMHMYLIPMLEIPLPRHLQLKLWPCDCLIELARTI